MDTSAFKALTRARAKSLTQWPLLIVLAVVIAGLVLVLLDHWRRGSALIGAGLCLGAFERAVLPDHVAGLLHVRSRVFDIVFLLGCGVGIILLAFFVPVPRS